MSSSVSQHVVWMEEYQLIHPDCTQPAIKKVITDHPLERRVPFHVKSRNTTENQNYQGSPEGCCLRYKVMNHTSDIFEARYKAIVELL